MVTEVVNVNSEEYVEYAHFCSSSVNLSFFSNSQAKKKVTVVQLHLWTALKVNKKGFCTKPVFVFLKLPPIHSNLLSQETIEHS